MSFLFQASLHVFVCLLGLVVLCHSDCYFQEMVMKDLNNPPKGESISIMHHPAAVCLFNTCQLTQKSSKPHLYTHRYTLTPNRPLPIRAWQVAQQLLWTVVVFLYIQGVWIRMESSMTLGLIGSETAWIALVRRRAWAAVASKIFTIWFITLHLLFSSSLRTVWKLLETLCSSYVYYN